MRRRGLSIVRPSRASHESKPWSCGFAARCAVRLGLTDSDPSTSIGLRPKMAGAARTKRAGASWKVEDFPHIRRHSRFGCTMRNPIGQFPRSGGRAASAAQYETQSVNSLHQAAEPLRLHNTKPNRSVPSIRRHSPIGWTIRNPIGQFPEATDAQARSLDRAAEPASHESKSWFCGFAARCAVGLGPTDSDPSTSIGLRPKMAGAARTKRAGASWKVEDFPHIRRHSRFGCTMRNPIGQFPRSGGRAASVVQCETQSVNSLDQAAEPLRLYNAKPNRSIPYIRRHSRSAAQYETQSVNSLHPAAQPDWLTAKRRKAVKSKAESKPRSS
jgi:hypothetical protein